jgi:hypothetical protein
MRSIKAIVPLLVAASLAAWPGPGCSCTESCEREDGTDGSDPVAPDEAPDAMDPAADGVGPDENAGDPAVDEVPPPPPLITVFHRRGFDFVLPRDAMRPEEQVDALSFRAATNEFEPVSFIVKADEDLTMTAAVSDLVCPGCDPSGGDAVLPTGALDLRVVKVWKQAGLGRKVTKASGIDVPELLVYDDGQELHSEWPFPADHLVDGEGGDPADRGLYLDHLTYLSFPTTGMDLQQGTVSMMFRPEDDPEMDPAEPRYLFNLRNVLENGNTQDINLFYMSSSGALTLQFHITGGTPQTWAAVIPVPAEGWHQVVLTWRADETDPLSKIGTLYLDAADPVRTEAGIVVPTDLPAAFALGSHINGTHPAYGTFDDLRVYSYAASADEVSSGGCDEERLALAADLDSLDDTRALAYDLRSSHMQYPTISRELRTVIPAGTVKQFWLTARTDGSEPGDYEGTITLLAEGKAPFEIPLTLTVLPFALEETADLRVFHMFYFKFSLDPHSDQTVDEAHLRTYLEDLRQHGVTGVSLTDGGDSYGRVLEILRDMGGFDIAVVNIDIDLRDPDEDAIREFLALMDAGGWERFLYGIDEPNASADFIAHVKRSTAIKLAGGKVATAIQFAKARCLREASCTECQSPPMDANHVDCTGQALDFPNYHITSLTLTANEEIDISHAQDDPLMRYIEDVRADPSSKNPGILESYYWQPWVQIPNMNRLMAGFFLALSGLDGCWPWGYINYGSLGRDAFSETDNDFDKYMRDAMTAYPSSDGPIPTTQWEAFREGVDDIRYLETLEERLDLNQGSMPERVAEIRTALAELLHTYENPWHDNVLPASRFEEDRDQLIEWILELPGE